MKLTKILVTAATITFLSASIAFSVPIDNDCSQKKIDTNINKPKCETNKSLKHQEPIKYLESRKADVKMQLKNGNLTKDEAKEITKKIDSKIKAIKKFNKLSLEQKRDKLITNFKTIMNKKIQHGKITKEKAEELIKEYTQKVNKWDGNGYPEFSTKYFGNTHSLHKHY